MRYTFNLNFTLDILQQCVVEGSNNPYWSHYYPHWVDRDLRNPKHTDKLEKVNVQGVKNLIHCCMGKKRRLIQISTVSVAGESICDMPDTGKQMHENELFFGQLLENDYVRSKFCAERAILEAIPKGLDAKIMRVGNLMARHSDGEFQINFRSSGFMRQLRGYKVLGLFRCL